MLLTISTTHQPATDLGYLLHKHPDRCQSFDLSFGKAHVFYPEANEDHCQACLLLDVDPVGMVRGRNSGRGANWKSGPLDQYVNDRPYVASSLMSVAISQVFRSALSGKSQERTELVDKEIPLMARIDVLPVRGGANSSETGLLQRMFEPLGDALGRALTYRVLLTGIHLMRTGEVEANLLDLNETAKLSYIDELVERKLAGPEKGRLDAADLEFYEREYERLVAELEAAMEKSSLPEQATGKSALNDLLIRLRTTSREKQ